MIQDHQPIKVNEFNGLFGIDSFTDSVPKDHFIDSLNTITNGSEIRTRDGVGLETTFPAIVRQYRWRIQGEASRKIVLNTSGQLFDLTVSAVTPILTIVAMTDFSVEPYNNRLYISPNNGVAGLPGEFVYVYTGAGTARKAAGLKPSTGFTASISASAGVIEEGTHIFAWVYETTSGFVTPPGPTDFQILTFDGTKKADFTLIPVGPSGTAKRRLIASRAIQVYNGNQNAYEMFFVPDGDIEDNVTTDLLGINFYDADLQLSVDYTFDQLEEIPAVLFLSSYGNRMVFGATDTDKNIVYISKMGEPESINSLNGFVSIDPHETEGVKDATEFRGNLYIFKKNKTYAGRDNTYDPSTWKFDCVDSSIGCDFNGVARYIDAKGSKSDFFIVGDSSGLFKYTGTYEEIALSWKIKNWWKRITFTYFNKIQIIVDAERFLIYILVPLDGAVSPNYVIVGEYENGLNFEKIKWHIWLFQGFSPSSISVDIDFLTKKTILKLSSLSGNIYSYEEGRINDNALTIVSFIKFFLAFIEPGAIHHYGGIGLRVKGSGPLRITLNGEDNIDTVTLTPLQLSSLTPGREFLRIAKFQSEKCSVELKCDSANEYFHLREMILYTNIVFNSRPG